jgi:hypothetical protein
VNPPLLLNDGYCHLHHWKMTRALLLIHHHPKIHKFMQIYYSLEPVVRICIMYDVCRVVVCLIHKKADGREEGGKILTRPSCFFFFHTTNNYASIGKRKRDRENVREKETWERKEDEEEEEGKNCKHPMYTYRLF